jgi:SAM-dependent methyltransferase
MNANKALWEKGDFSRIAATMRTSGEQFVEQIGVTAGAHVLDLGSGDGTTAVPAAQLGADVLGVDIASNLVAAGNRRAEALGLSNCKFQEGDASDLIGIDDGVFDLTVSVFGAMFAPKPFEVAKEMVRVTRPGGRIVMANWIPGDPTMVAQLLRISAAYAPPPPAGFVSPMTWGEKDNVAERFASAGVSPDRVSCTESTFTFHHVGSPSNFVRAFRTYYGPTMNAFESAEARGRADDMQRELEELFIEQNVSATPGTTTIPATFLHVVVDV